MNLAWIVAVLRPLDIAPHPNFNDSGYDAQPYAQLAATVSGNPYRSHYGAHGEGSDSFDRGVLNAEMSLTTEGLRVGLGGLISEVFSEEPGDHARLCSLGLLACCAAAELDDYDTCDRILEHLLAATANRQPEEKLIRSIMLQQQSLRFRDSGREYYSQISEVLELLDELDRAEFQEFPMSPGATLSPADSIRSILIALRHAAWSLTPTRQLIGDREPLPTNIPSWQEVVRTPKSSLALEIHRLRASEYAQFVDDSFKRMFRSQTKTIGGRGDATLFFASLHFELLGDSAVYGLRKESSLMKLIQVMSARQADTADVADALRLLRHSGAKSEIDLAVERVRATGPLEALKKDSQQIVKNRSEPRMIRPAELRILRAAADLMTEDEARTALGIVRRVIEAGGAQSSPGSVQLDVVRLEPAWLAASHLASVAGEDESISDLLLDAAMARRQNDELWDKAVGRALRNLDWDNVSPSARSRWHEFFRSNPSHMPATRSVFEAFAQQEVTPEEAALGSLEAVANRVNSAIAGVQFSDAEVNASIETVRASLAGIREQANNGVWSFQFLDPADVAAGLIVFAGASALWDDLCSFLTDPQVQRSDKSGALDRLASAPVELPHRVEAALRRAGRSLLEATADYFEGSSVTPFPSALRFLASHRLIEESETFSLVAKMSGSIDPESREEASRTVAVLASSAATPWLLTQAMQLSHDSEPKVRAHAARALALFCASLSDFKEAAENRLVELMAEEGIIVPILAMRQMRQSENVSDTAKRTIGALAVHHASRTVRREASLLLGEAP
ncbi:hypothetical protein ACFVIB_06275 [Streptomyces nigra]|uniref:hypothetical protein n=1 Tax=Streptomyces nigra TaxID=1827580 RepID=UPI003638FAAE